MRVFECECGAPLFFDARKCVACARGCAYVPAEDRFVTGDITALCANGKDHGACNWLSEEPGGLCIACQLNRTIPNLSVPHNLTRWQRIEDAKRRLLYTLRSLGLPLYSGHTDVSDGLLFDFMEGVTTGYADGVVTLNVEEADDAAREAQRVALNETYRSLLGHLRHESGHHFLRQARRLPGADDLLAGYGNFESDYAQALQRHYADGPPANWQQRYISAYASAHPLEDWAETWSHFLHIYDVLDTAHAHGIITSHPAEQTQTERLHAWGEISVMLNELNRSAGVGDAYPFVITAQVRQKLQTVALVIEQLGRSGA